MTAIVRPPAVAEAAAHRAAILEASAGTGKTYTIEHLVIELLLGGRRYDPERALTIDQIVVVTFTEKATAEMRLRIRSRIAEIARSPESSSPDGWIVDAAARTALEQAVVNFSLASISTIHGFCQRTLAEFALLTGAWLAPEVVDSSQVIRRMARERLRSTWLIEAETAQPLAEWVSSGTTIENILEMVREAVSAGWGDDSTLSLERILDVECANLTPDTLDALIATANAAAAKEGDGGDFVRGIDLLRRLDLHQPRIDLLAQLREGRGALAPLDKHLLTKDGNAHKTKCKDQNAGMAMVAIGRLVRLDVPRLGLIDRMVRDVTVDLAALRKKERVTDYDHMVRGLADALRGPSGQRLADALRARYRVALVDEFQDTDAAQWTIFDTVFLQGQNTRLFVIGDPKQAIYRFRRADVQVYLEATRQMETQHGATRIRLGENFRSTANMIEAYNRILDQNAPTPVLSGAIDYSVPVAAGRPAWRDTAALVDNEGRPVGPVGLLELDMGVLKKRARLKAALADAVVDDIERLVRSPAHRLWIGDASDPMQRRPVKASGIFVLTRSHNEAAAVVRRLKERGLAVRYKGKETLLENPDLVGLADVFDALAHPADRGLRQRALFSVFFAVPIEQTPAFLAQLTPQGALLDQLAELASKCLWPRVATRLLHESGVCERLVANQDLDRLAQIEQMLELVVAQTANRVMTAVELVTLLRSWSAKLATPGGASPDPRSVDEREAVTVMTMHTSKGLEADVVYLCGGVTQSSSSARGSMLNGTVRGRRCLGISGLASTDELVSTAKEQDAAELRRLAYVALTRARVRLVVPWFDTDAKTTDRRGRSSAPRGEFDFVWKRVAELATEPGFEPIVPEPPELEERPATKPLYEPRPFVDDDARRALLRIAPTVSYSSLKEARELTIDLSGIVEDPDRSLEQGSIDADSPDDALPGASTVLAPWMPRGTRPGRLVHGVLEHIDLDQTHTAATPGSPAEVDLHRLVTAQLAMHGLPGTLVADTARICLNSVLVPLPLPGAPGLAHCATVARELELFFAVGEPGLPSVWVKGFADVLIEHQGRFAMLDWKTDAIDTVDPATLRSKVDSHYGAQVALYLLALCRQIGVVDETDYDARVAGAIYVFVRALDQRPDPAAVVCVRPSYAQLLDFQQQLHRRFAAGAGAEA